MDIAIATILYGGPWVLVVMGAIVAVKPPPREDRKARYRWIIAFGIIAALVTGAQIWSDVGDRAAREAFEVRLTGGDNYAFFTVETNIAPDGENYVLTTTTGPMPIFDCSVRFLSPDGEIVGGREWSFRPLPKTTARFSHMTLPPGQYRADCIMGEKTWQQHFEFKRTPQGLDQAFRVKKDGELVKEWP